MYVEGLEISSSKPETKIGLRYFIQVDDVDL